MLFWELLFHDSVAKLICSKGHLCQCIWLAFSTKHYICSFVFFCLFVFCANRTKWQQILLCIHKEGVWVSECDEWIIWQQTTSQCDLRAVCQCNKSGCNCRNDPNHRCQLLLPINENTILITNPKFCCFSDRKTQHSRIINLRNWVSCSKHTSYQRFLWEFGEWGCCFVWKLGCGLQTRFVIRLNLCVCVFCVQLLWKCKCTPWQSASRKLNKTGQCIVQNDHDSNNNHHATSVSTVQKINQHWKKFPLFVSWCCFSCEPKISNWEQRTDLNKKKRKSTSDLSTRNVLSVDFQHWRAVMFHFWGFQQKGGQKRDWFLFLFLCQKTQKTQHVPLLLLFDFGDVSQANK